MLKGCVRWPEELARRYRAAGYWRGERLGDLLRPWARSEPERTALVAGDRRWSYGGLDRAADRLSAGLARLGVRRSDRVVIQLPNSVEFVTLCIALFRLGALPIFALPGHRRSEIVHLCRSTEAAAYVIPDIHQGFDYRELARDVRREAPTVRHVLVAGKGGGFPRLADVDSDPDPLPALDPEDVAFFLLSGGTTGTPKLIPRTHDDYAYQLRATAEGLDFDASGVYLAALPVAHNAALGCPGVLGALRSGGKVVLAASPSPDEVFRLVQREGVTLTTLMPSIVQLWMDSVSVFHADLSRLLLQVGGAKLSPEVARKVGRVLGCRLTHWFGMAEGLLTYTRLDDPQDVVVSTQGRPLSPDDEIRIVGPGDREVPPGEPGELLVRGPYTVRGYYRANAENEKAFTPEGFLRTGDLARITHSGNIVVEGRLKDVINRGGEKVSAEELEDHLSSHSSVRDVAVVALADEVLGEKICAFVVPTGSPASLSQLKEHLATRGVAVYKRLDRLELVDHLPRTGVGKVDKTALRERAGGLV